MNLDRGLPFSGAATLSWIALLILPAALLGNTYFVPDDFSTIQSAIDHAAAGDTILVKPGTYLENIDYKGKNLVLKGEQGPDVTVLDGNQTGSVVIFNTGESSGAVLEGFTITNGSGTYTFPSTSGGAIYCYLTSPTIRYNIIIGNDAGQGGGIYSRVGYGHTELRGNTIALNSAQTGGALYFEGHFGDARIIDNTIWGNAASLNGGAISGWSTALIIDRNRFNNNTAIAYGGAINLTSDFSSILTRNLFDQNFAYSGGALSCQDSDPPVSDNLFIKNGAFKFGAAGGGIFCLGDDATPVISNNTFTENYAAGFGGALAANDLAAPIVEHCIFWNNTAVQGDEIGLGSNPKASTVTIRYSDVTGGIGGTYTAPGSTLNWGPGMIDQDPLFVNPQEGDFLLQQDPCQPGVINPCVDAGDPAVPPAEGTTRTDGFPDAGVMDLGSHAPRSHHVPSEHFTIQDAMDAAAEGETVLVAPGTYGECIDFKGKALTVRSSHGAAVTVIDGNQTGSGVAFRQGESESAVLRGFTVRNGSGTLDADGYNGGGVYCMDASPTLMDNILCDNTVVNRGGGLYCYRSHPKALNNLIRGNTAGNQGGGIACIRAALILTNNTLHGNVSDKGGGWYSEGAFARIHNGILWNNQAQNQAEIAKESGKLRVRFTDVAGGWPGKGNIDGNPLFRDPAGGDFSLSGESPCVDGGDNDAPAIPDCDFEGQPRILDGDLDGNAVADMGWDELFPLAVPQHYPTIQSALTAAQDGDTVLVSPGTYPENIDFLGKAVTVRSVAGPETTVIDGGQAGTVVTFAQGENPEAVIQGFTLINGSGTPGGSGSSGGGIRCFGSSPTILGNRITLNTVDGVGGGIWCDASAAPRVVNNILWCNTAGIHGGGMAVSGGSAPFLTNNTFFENASDLGGGLSCEGGADVVVYNAIFWGNMATLGPQISVGDDLAPSSLMIRYSTVEGGKANIFVDTGCTLDWGLGMIGANPQLKDPRFGDFHLLLTSPCIDTGGNSAPFLPRIDMEGDPRVVTGTGPAYGNQCFPAGPKPVGVVDMGADELFRMGHQGTPDR